jgi:hypothetical protein
MIINVLQKDIKNGVANTCDKCPVALAVRRATHKRVKVGYVFVGVNRTWYGLPKEATTFIKRFDMGKSVKPFRFTISNEKETV